MRAKLFFTCLALGGLMSCATAPTATGPSPEAIAKAANDPHVGKDYWAAIPLSVNAVPDISKEPLKLPPATHFKIVGMEQGVLIPGKVMGSDFYYRLVLDDGRTVYYDTILVGGTLSDGPPEDLSKASDRDIVRRILQQNHDNYEGQCACPDDRTYNGRACGGRSAYSRKRGIKCYPADVSKGEVAEYRATPHFRSVQ
jgi:hypothetical protein